METTTKPLAPPVALAAPRPGRESRRPAPWGDEFELRVNFEINRPEAEKGRYRRPYVAIWVEDKAGSRFGTCRSGSRWAVPGRSSGSPT